MYQTWIGSPIGNLVLAADGQSLTGLWMESQKYFPTTLDFDVQPELPVFQQTQEWLSAYWEKAPLPAMPPLAPQGSPFQSSFGSYCWKFPMGKLLPMVHLADQLRAQGISAAAQAVGGAVGHNPISILIPCHRVVGSNGSLTGYAGGVGRKYFLLELEGADMTKLYLPKRGTAL